MTMVEQELLPNSTSFLNQYFYAQKIQDKLIDISEAIITKKIIPIIQSKTHIQESDIETFMEDCKELTNMLYNEYDFEKTIKSNLEVYQMCLQKIDQSDLSNENKNKIHYILNSLKDYMLSITVIAKRKEELKDIDQKINYPDFKKSLYGTMLAFVCIMVVILRSSSIKTEPNALIRLIEDGLCFSYDLDSYVDTIDILTNPKELELLKKSESYIK